jgi:hypothetical protein
VRGWVCWFHSYSYWIIQLPVTHAKGSYVYGSIFLVIYTIYILAGFCVYLNVCCCWIVQHLGSGCLYGCVMTVSGGSGCGK